MSVYQSIQAYIIPQTDRRPWRVKALATMGESLTMNTQAVPPNCGSPEAYVAMKLAAKLGWDGYYVEGVLPKRKGAVFVSVGKPGGQWTGRLDSLAFSVSNNGSVMQQYHNRGVEG